MCRSLWLNLVAGLAAVANLSGLALKHSIAFDHFQGANREGEDQEYVVVGS